MNEPGSDDCSIIGCYGRADWRVSLTTEIGDVFVKVCHDHAKQVMRHYKQRIKA